MATSVETATRPASADLVSIRQVALWTLLAAKAIGGWGVQWDIRWHLVIGRDSFWIAPHLMTYAGVTVGALVSFGVLVRETWAARRGEPSVGALRVLGLVGSPGFHLAWWGMAVTIIAAPIDDLWHRLFGIDVTLWSPPHLLGMAGAQINTLGCMFIALELWPRGSRARTAALLAGGTLLLAAFFVITDPAFQTAFLRGGVFFFTWAILGSLAFTWSLVLAARLAHSRIAPVVLAAGALAMHAVGLVVSDIGFAITRPTSAIEEVIAADPSSPIAIAHEMARRNGTEPGRAMRVRVFPLLPAALMTFVNPRRRPALASAALAVGLVIVSVVMLGSSPALSHALPAATDVGIALAVALVASFVGAALAVALSDRREPASSRP